MVFMKIILTLRLHKTKHRCFPAAFSHQAVQPYWSVAQDLVTVKFRSKYSKSMEALRGRAEARRGRRDMEGGNNLLQLSQVFHL